MRNTLQLSALDAVIMLAAVIAMFVIDAANVSGALKFVVLCLIGIACLYFLIKLVKRII